MLGEQRGVCVHGEALSCRAPLKVMSTFLTQLLSAFPLTSRAGDKKKSKALVLHSY